MVLAGVIVNTIAIIVGGLLGQVFTNIKQETKDTIMKAIAVAILVLGLNMALKGVQSEYFLIVLFSLVLGGVWGEWAELEKKLEKLGQWIESKVGKKKKGNIAKAFVTTTLIYCIGAMAVIGALDSGLRMDHNVLYTKSFLDGFTAIIFSSTLGIGVVFSAIPVFLYQGIMALGATYINQFVEPQLIERIIEDITATGGILIVGIALNMLEVTKLKVGNLLPSLLVAVLLTAAVYYIQLML
ncbi:DUF554 domain-containing protein [Caldalkalibacillus mannanilyticus]|uniref:DUF554 domain-containing protein n=1 Tax=Caldalkalibacillus mannanilyticus TaxID=1418 RepID=UPI0004695745|nr:DUF554 domain-containing protein [Caldalkalibacillus mannanilyticus]